MSMGFFNKLSEQTSNVSGDIAGAFSHSDLIYPLGHSLALGFILFVITYITSAKGISPDKLGSKFIKEKIKLLNGSANILFLCIGLTAIMILVNDNIARAFSIGAAIALVRFRIRLGQKTVGSNVLFGIIAGISCGLNQIPLAWMMTGIYLVLTVVLTLIVQGLQKGIVVELNSDSATRSNTES